MEEIQRMQDNLLLIRRAVGWTAEEFGDKIGVTRQTINNIESGRNKLSKTQYIAMRSVLDAEIMNSPDDTEMLRVLLEVFVDEPDKYKEEEREQLLAKANLMVPSILAGTTSREDVSKEWTNAAKFIVGGALSIFGMACMGIGVSTWLKKLIDKRCYKDVIIII